MRQNWPSHWKAIELSDIAQLKNGVNFKSQQKGKGILTVDVYEYVL